MWLRWVGAVKVNDAFKAVDVLQVVEALRVIGDTQGWCCIQDKTKNKCTQDRWCTQDEMHSRQEMNTRVSRHSREMMHSTSMNTHSWWCTNEQLSHKTSPSLCCRVQNKRNTQTFTKHRCTLCFTVSTRETNPFLIQISLDKTDSIKNLSSLADTNITVSSFGKTKTKNLKRYRTKGEKACRDELCTALYLQDLGWQKEWKWVRER